MNGGNVTIKWPTRVIFRYIYQNYLTIQKQNDTIGTNLLFNLKICNKDSSQQKKPPKYSALHRTMYVN